MRGSRYRAIRSEFSGVATGSQTAERSAGYCIGHLGSGLFPIPRPRNVTERYPGPEPAPIYICLQLSMTPHAFSTTSCILYVIDVQVSNVPTCFKCE